MIAAALLLLLVAPDDDLPLTPAMQERLTTLAACTAHAINAMPKATEAHAAATAAIAGCASGRDAVRQQLARDVAAQDHLSAAAAHDRVVPMLPELDGVIADRVLHYATTYGGMTAN